MARSIAMRLGGIGIAIAILLPALAARAWADEAEHTVRYVVTADGDREVTIHYRIASPTENWAGTHYENFWIGPDNPWEATTTLDDPYGDAAYVSVRNIWWNPNFRCELWVDGKLAMKGEGYCSLKGKRPRD
ncbi:hypothetical protein [Mycobacteroides franklinii]|uniref:hypothetical protein n=1 Tax=Mycobacteroides franklinii TaxID=948102 RepID=UPI0012FF87AD|nr:hypothetical protein [Mycobacteroides franklinii]